MGHTHNFQSSGWGCQILPWSWDSKSRLIGISQGYKRGVNSENQVWEGQNGAMRRIRAPLTFTLHSIAGISFIGRNTYSLTCGHGWANASMPRVVEKLRENQSGHWDDSWEAKRSTSDLLKRSQIWDTVWRFNIHSPGLSFCLDRKSAARFSIPGTWTALKERKPVQGARPWPSLMVYVGHNRHIVRSDYDMIPPENGEKIPRRQPWVPGSLYAKRGTLPSTPCSPVCPQSAPQPVIDASFVIIWRQWIAPILTPLWRKAGSRHSKRVRQQLRDTLVRRVAGTVGCNLSSFIH